jgi:hypothetical protein
MWGDPHDPRKAHDREEGVGPSLYLLIVIAGWQNALRAHPIEGQQLFFPNASKKAVSVHPTPCTA